MKNKLFTRVLVFVLCFVFSFGFAGCGGGGDTDETITVRDELRATELKIIFAAESTPEDNVNVLKAINDKLAQDGKPYTVKFEFLSFTNYMTNVEDKAKNGYDAAWVHIDNVPSMREKGVIKKDIKPYLDVWGQKIYEEVPDYVFKQVTARDEKIYAIPRHAPMANDREVMMVRGDWMKEIGMTQMNTLAQYDEYLSKIDKKYGDSNDRFAACLTDTTFLLREYAPNFYFPFYDYAKRPVYIDITDNKYEVKSFYNTQNFLDMAAKAAEYYDAGYMPKQSVTNVEEYFYNNLTGALCEYSVLKMTERVDAFKLINKSGELYDFIIDERITDGGETEALPKTVFRSADNLIVSLVNSQNAEELCDFISWTKNQENYDLVNYGVKDVNYFLTDEGRITLTHPETDRVIPANKQFMVKMPYWAFNDIDYMRWSDGLTQEYIDGIKNWESKNEDGTLNYRLNPLIGFNIENTPAFITARAKVSQAESTVDFLMQGKSKFDEPERPGSEVTVYQKLLSDLRANNAMADLIKEVQRQLDVFLNR